MNNPVSDETVPIKEDQIRYWKEAPLTYSSVLAVDPAYSDDEKSDFKTCSHIAIDQQMNRYLLSYVRTHQPIGEFQNAIINLWVQNRGTITAVGIPNSGVEKAFFDSFMKKCDERKLYPPVVELKNAFTQTGTSISIRGKKARVTAALQPLFEQGKYFINPSHIEARDELLTIGSSRWDDIVDTMAYGEQILTPSYYTNEPKRNYDTEEPSREINFAYGD
jgi:phage terminase large subunit-like protein